MTDCNTTPGTHIVELTDFTTECFDRALRGHYCAGRTFTVDVPKASVHGYRREIREAVKEGLEPLIDPELEVHAVVLSCSSTPSPNVTIAVEVRSPVAARKADRMDPGLVHRLLSGVNTEMALRDVLNQALAAVAMVEDSKEVISCAHRAAQRLAVKADKTAGEEGFDSAAEEILSQIRALQEDLADLQQRRANRAEQLYAASIKALKPGEVSEFQGEGWDASSQEAGKAILEGFEAREIASHTVSGPLGERPIHVEPFSAYKNEEVAALLAACRIGNGEK